jgi:hypothetical protein
VAAMHDAFANGRQLNALFREVAESHA